MSLEKGMVPAASVAPILRRHLDSQPEGHASKAHGSLPRILKRWENEVEWVGFDSVDDIFCHISDTPLLLWLEIEDVYYGCNVDAAVSRIRYCERVGCSNKIDLAQARGSVRATKRFCSTQCRRAAQATRRRGVKTRIRGKSLPEGGHSLTQMECLHGHELTPDNVYVSRRKHGIQRQCKTCIREQHRASRERLKAARMAA